MHVHMNVVIVKDLQLRIIMLLDKREINLIWYQMCISYS